MIIIQNQTPPHVWPFEYACSMSCMLSVVDIGVVLRELDSNTRSIRVEFFGCGNGFTISLDHEV